MSSNTISERHRKAVVAVGLGSVVLGTMGIGHDSTIEAIAYTPWSRVDVYNLGTTGLGEKYGGVGTGNSQWVDDNLWPSSGGAPEAGADCSGYVGKIWQMSAAPRLPATNDPIYPSSTDWHTGGGWAQSWGAVNIPLNDSRTRQADAWAYPGHMGLFEGTANAGGAWKIWHAASPTIGITHDYRTDQSLNNSNAKRFKRGNW